MPDTLPNLRHLQLLADVARAGSVSAVARASHLTQPAITQAISSLEHEFGATLFDRSGRGMAPTETGRRCVARVERVLDRITQALRSIGPNPPGDAITLRAVSASRLCALVAAAGAGGFGAAARAGTGSRAALHRSVRELERTLGAALFEPTSHGSRPTRDALRLVLDVRLAIAEIAQARAEAASGAGVERGSTVIGAMPLARSAIVPAAILEFAAAHPRHSVSILDGPYESMLEALRDGRADVLVGALRERAPHDVRQEALFDDALMIVARRGHPLGRTRAATIRRLAGYPWIAPRPGSPLRRHFDRLMEALPAGITTVPIECNSLAAARALLLRSDRLMLLSAHQVEHELAAGELMVRPHPFGRVTRTIGLTLRRDWLPTAVQADLLSAIRREAKSAFGGLGAGSRGRRPSAG
jgi:DNA-binding transcriptional LysR family regulator